jgi:hypothetical protein
VSYTAVARSLDASWPLGRPPLADDGFRNKGLGTNLKPHSQLVGAQNEEQKSLIPGTPCTPYPKHVRRVGGWDMAACFGLTV